MSNVTRRILRASPDYWRRIKDARDDYRTLRAFGVGDDRAAETVSGRYRVLVSDVRRAVTLSA